MASMYPFGGPRLRDGPRNVQAEIDGIRASQDRRGGDDSRVPRTIQLLQGSPGAECSHLHFDLRH